MPTAAVEITPASNRLIRSLMNQKNIEIAMQGALREASSWVLGQTLQSFSKETQSGEGGVRWPRNYGDQPGGYAWFKKVVLGQNPVQVGAVNGKLRRSISAELNVPSLECRIGSPLLYAQGFHDGQKGHVFWMIGRKLDHPDRGRRIRHAWMTSGAANKKDRPYRFPPFGQTPVPTPPRPFLPTEISVGKQVEEILTKALDRQYNKAGGGA